METLEAITGLETENEYQIYLTGADCAYGADQKPYFSAEEESTCCCLCCCGNMREFNMIISGPDGVTALLLERPYKCTCCCCNLPELRIKDGDGNHIGVVKNRFHCCNYVFDVLDHLGNPVLKINGDCCQCGNYFHCPCGSCSEICFDIINPETGSTGFIKKVWSGCVREMVGE